MSTPSYLKWLDEVELSDIDTVGGKNASLGEMIRNLKNLGVHVPGGFVVTVASYHAFIAHNDLDQKIRDIVAKLDVDDVVLLRSGALLGDGRKYFRINCEGQKVVLTPVYSEENVETTGDYSTDAQLEFSGDASGMHRLSRTI